MHGLVQIDVYQSMRLKEGKPKEAVAETFSEYHSLVKEAFSIFKGESWHEMGDGRICVFPTANDAVDGSLRVLEGLAAFNANKNRLGSPVLVRIGVHEIDRNDIANVPEGKRGKFAHRLLDVVGKLEKNCPVGKVALSTQVYEKLGPVKKDLFRPAVAPELRRRKALILRRHPIMPQEEVLLRGLTDQQKMSIPPIPFTTWDEIGPEENTTLASVDKIVEEPVLVILGETTRPPQGPISPAATSDAIGIIEIMAAVKSNRNVVAGVDQWEDTADLAFDRNIILIGSGIANTYAFAFNDIVRPAHFAKTDGRVFNQIVASGDDGENYFGPHTKYPEDCGLVSISKSPLNLEKTLLWIAGITGMGTQASARLVWDLLRDPNVTLRHVAGARSPIACVVSPSIAEGAWELSDYYRRWRIPDYRILWMVDRDGKARSLPLD